MVDNLNETILHVDDYVGARYFVRRVLHQAGFDVVSVADGQTCLQRAEDGPSLIILDINLPDINGLELCRRLRADPATAHIPILYLSATYVSLEDKVRGLNGGADGYLVEPLEASELLATVQALLNHERRLRLLREKGEELERVVQDLRQRLRVQDEVNGESLQSIRDLQAEIEAEWERLQQVEGLQDHIISRMSHEFRTPLNTILALTRLLLDRLDGELTPEQETQVRLVRQAASELSQLVDDVLELVRLETGKLPVRCEEFTIARLFTSLRGIFRPLHDNDAVALIFTDPTDIPPLYTDRGKVTQIMHNLISNSLRFTERGEVRVQARWQPVPDHVLLVVQDTGIGIAPEDQERIFERFIQLAAPTPNRCRGLGLGLPLCRELAHLLGGEVRVQSQPGQGATFSVTLPRLYPDRSVTGQESASC